MTKQIEKIKKKLDKLYLEKKTLEENIELLEMEREELENKEIVAICRENTISLEQLYEMVKKENKNEKEKTL